LIEINLICLLIIKIYKVNILITGSTGFVGNNFLKQIKENGWFCNDLIYILSANNIVKSEYFNINYDSYILSENIFGEINFDIVFHFGAFTPKNSIEFNNIDKSTSNIHFTYSLLRALKNKCKQFIFLSTLDVYSKNELIISEASVIEPISLYGYSKLYCEKLIESWAEKETVLIQILRLAHIFGPGEDEYQKLIPITINNILKGISPVIYNNGKEKRSFLYVDDCCNLIKQSICLPFYVGPVNIASGFSISVKSIVENLLLISKKNIELLNKEILDYKPRDIVFDNEKMHKYLGHEKIEITSGLEMEYNYFKIKSKSV